MIDYRMFPTHTQGQSRHTSDTQCVACSGQGKYCRDCSSYLTTMCFCTSGTPTVHFCKWARTTHYIYALSPIYTHFLRDTHAAVVSRRLRAAISARVFKRRIFSNLDARNTHIRMCMFGQGDAHGDVKIDRIQTVMPICFRTMPVGNDLDCVGGVTTSPGCKNTTESTLTKIEERGASTLMIRALAGDYRGI